ncbi:MAG TPA: hypothetical protein PLL69_02570 [Gemmatimonadales bacterium]|nr:hypothetical protein [Gemmatimonadales bacterium]
MRKVLMGAALLAVAACGEKQAEDGTEMSAPETAPVVEQPAVHDSTHPAGDSTGAVAAPDSAS